MYYIIQRMITKTRLIFMTMIIASLTLGIAAVTTNTQPASAQSRGGGMPSYTPPGGSAGSASPGNSTSGNGTK
jgi:uncharacterized membrane protein